MEGIYNALTNLYFERKIRNFYIPYNRTERLLKLLKEIFTMNKATKLLRAGIIGAGALVGMLIAKGFSVEDEPEEEMEFIEEESSGDEVTEE